MASHDRHPASLPCFPNSPRPPSTAPARSQRTASPRSWPARPLPSASTRRRPRPRERWRSPPTCCPMTVSGSILSAMAAGSASGLSSDCSPSWMYGAAWATMMALLVACSSSGKGEARGGAGGTIDSAGSGGEGGGSGAGGAAGQVSDTAVGATVDANGNDVAGAMTAEQACQAAFRARCQRSAVCGGDPDNWQSCADVSVNCPEYFFNSGSTRTVAGVTACLDEQARQPCTDLGLGLFPSCWSLGTRPAGAACAYSSSCASGRCSTVSDGTACGHCEDGPAATGDSCAKLHCRMGDFCHPGTQLCTPGGTVVHAAKGQACDLSAVPAVGCAGDSQCLMPDGQTAGTCQPMPLLDLGQPCYRVLGICRPPLTCFTLVDGTNITSECRAPDPEPLCGAAPCDAATYCKTVDKKPTCVPKAAVGESCTGDAGTVTTECAPGSFCVGKPGICTKYGNRGDPCNADSQPCSSNLVCSNGRCALGGEACL